MSLPRNVHDLGVNVKKTDVVACKTWTNVQKSMSLPGNVQDLGANVQKSMSFPGNVQDLGANVQKTDVVTWKRAGLGCERAKNRCRYLETCRTWVPTCKKPMSLPGNVQDLGANVQKPMSFPGNVQDLGANVQKTDVVTWKRAGLGCQRAKN